MFLISRGVVADSVLASNLFIPLFLGLHLLLLPLLNLARVDLTCFPSVVIVFLPPQPLEGPTT